MQRQKCCQKMAPAAVHAPNRDSPAQSAPAAAVSKQSACPNIPQPPSSQPRRRATSPANQTKKFPAARQTPANVSPSPASSDQCPADDPKTPPPSCPAHKPWHKAPRPASCIATKTNIPAAHAAESALAPNPYANTACARQRNPSNTLPRPHPEP